MNTLWKNIMITLLLLVLIAPAHALTSVPTLSTVSKPILPVLPLQVTGTLNMGQVVTYTLNGHSYETTLVFMSDPTSQGGGEAKLSINGELTTSLAKGETQTMNAGVTVYINEIIWKGNDGQVTFTLTYVYPVTRCVNNGREYTVGESFKQDCNVCSCTEKGVIACTMMACPPTEGEVCTADVQTCSVVAGCTDANSVCTKQFVECPGTLADCRAKYGDCSCGTKTDDSNRYCSYNGQVHKPGETFKDGCNTCTCTATGDVACTKMPCVNPVQYTLNVGESRTISMNGKDHEVTLVFVSDSYPTTTINTVEPAAGLPVQKSTGTSVQPTIAESVPLYGTDEVPPTLIKPVPTTVPIVRKPIQVNSAKFNVDGVLTYALTPGASYTTSDGLQLTVLFISPDTGKGVGQAIFSLTYVGSAGGYCVVDGRKYVSGESFKQDCNTCSCTANGKLICTMRACPPTDDEACLANVQTCTVVNGCTTPSSTCTKQVIECSGPLADCRVKYGDCTCGTKIDDTNKYCSYNGQLYKPGETFKRDCNTCSCNAGGQVVCTKIACPVLQCKVNADCNAGSYCTDGVCIATNNGNGAYVDTFYLSQSRSYELNGEKYAVTMVYGADPTGQTAAPTVRFTVNNELTPELGVRDQDLHSTLVWGGKVRMTVLKMYSEDVVDPKPQSPLRNVGPDGETTDSTRASIAVLHRNIVLVRIEQGANGVNNTEGSACTKDAKICPDGSVVGRVVPDCSFAPCPTTTAPPTASCTNGCTVDGRCLPYGTRVVNGEAKFCDVSAVMSVQKVDDSTCQNNYECISNQCLNAKCQSLEKQLKETQGTLDSVVSWLRSMFGIGK